MSRSAHALVLALVVSTAAARATTTFTVTVEAESPDVVRVAGEFELPSETLAMYITSSPQLEGGQADLIRELRVFGPSGAALPVEYAGEGDWRVPASAVGGRVTIEYEIALEHGRYTWGPGIDEVAYRQEDGLFFTGFSLFVVPSAEPEGPIDVHFELPRGWVASTPWERQRTGGGVHPQSFRPTDLSDLLRNCLFLGRHLEESISIDGFDFVLAVGGDLKAKKQLFVDAMTPLLPAYVEMFGGMPSASRYLVVINPGDRSDGGAFPGSYSMLIRGEVDRASSAVWAHGIAHELAHFWNGHTIVPANPSDEEWFKEGFTDYVTLVQLSRTGLDPWEITARKLENMARRYVVARHLLGLDDSLVSAGADKHRKRFLVYGGGALAALALEVRIREATDNAAGIDELMRAMYRRFGETGKAYTTADIVAAATAVSGADQSEFFDRYVRGRETLDIEPVFEALGLRLTTMVDEFYVSGSAQATAAERAMGAVVFGAAVGTPGS